MRALTAVAVLILAAGIAPSVALPLPGSISEHAARTPGVRPQVKPVPNPPAPPAPRPPAAPPAPRSPAARPTRPIKYLSPRPPAAPAPRPPPTPPDPPPPPIALYPLRGSWQGSPPPQAQKFRRLKKLWGKLFGKAPIATPPSDEVFGQPNSRPELLERFDELLIELVARGYEDSEELPTTSIDDLD